MYKIRLQRHLFWNMQQMNEVTRHFCWHQNFVPWLLAAPTLALMGLQTCIKSLKYCIKSNFFLTLAMGMQNVNKIYQKVQGIGPVSLFSEFEPRQNFDLSQVSFDILIGYILPISMCMQNFITIFFTVLQIGSFSLFQNLELGKASTDKKCHFAISWARSCQYQCLRKSLSKYSTQFKRSLATSCQYKCVCKISSQYSSQVYR